MNYFLYLCVLAFIDILCKLKSFASMCYFKSTTDYIAWIIKLELKVIKHDLIGLKKEILIDLRSVEVDCPSHL